YQFGNKKWGDVTQARVDENLVVLLDRAQPADTNTNQHADIIGVLFGDLEPRLAHRLLGGRDRVLDEGVHLFDVAFFDPVLGIEVPDLAGDAGGEIRGDEASG